MHESFSLQGIQVAVDASVGIACSPAHGTTAESILSRADIAMYRAKRLRTGVELFQTDTDNPTRGRLEMVTDLRAAFAENQFQLFYQPQMRLGTGDIIGVEALVRWHHPEHGLVAPAQFLHLLQRFNLMDPLTDFVLRQALSDCSLLYRSGFPLRMSVNIAASDLISEALADTVVTMLAEHNLTPDLLVIEVTEDSVMTDRIRSLRTLHEISAIGVDISVDDYGTGQASLSYIRDLPITELKLDRSFLQGVPADHHNSAIIRSTIELAHALHLPVVAEGVEDSVALDWLRELGCDIGQGFHILRPVPVDELLDWLRQRTGHDFSHESEWFGGPLADREPRSSVIGL